MHRLTVLLAPSGPLVSTLSVLQDWSAAGLVDDFVWVEPEGLSAYDANVLYVRSGNLQGGTLRNVIADVNPRETTLSVLVPRLDGAGVVSPADEQAVAQLLDGAGGTATVRVRCVVTIAGVARSVAEIARDGWHNVVLAPESRARPDGHPVFVSDTTDPRQLGIHAALGLAGLLGLWNGLEASPALTGPPQAGRSARLASSYVRWLRDGEVGSRLRRSVLATDVSLPRPRRLGASDVYVPEPERATMAMADLWWETHRADLIQQREVVPAEQPRPTSVLEALREFFAFLWAAIRNAPGSWFENKRRQLSAGLARRVTSAVYGAGSAYTVVVSGVTGDGMPVGWLEAGRAVGEVEAALDAANVGIAQQASGELGGLWSDFIGGALTLADGAARVNGLPPVRVDAGIGVVKDTAQIAPADDQAFTGVSGHLSAVVDIHKVPPADVLTRLDLQQRLAAVRDQDLQLDVREAAEGLRQWQTTTRTTYSVRVAEHIGKAQLDTRAEIGRLLSSMNDDAASHDGQNDVQKQRRLARRLKIMLVGVVIAVAIVAVVVFLGVIALGIGIGLGAILLIGGLIGMARTFYVQQKHVFQMLHRREQLEKSGAATIRNLRAAMRDLRRQIEAYGQLQVWARVLAAFLTAPFGRTPSAGAQSMSLAGPFPRGMSVGDVVATEDAVDTAVAELRRDVFAVGWLSAPWDALLEAAASLVGPSAPDTIDSPRALYDKPSAAWLSEAESLLAIWGDAVVRNGAPTSAGDSVWRSISESLHGSRSNLASVLTSRIALVGGSRSPVDVHEFMGGIDSERHAPAFFDAGILSDSAASQTMNQVTTEVPAARHVGLARTASLVQFSSYIPHYDFRAGTSPAPRTTTPAPNEVRTPQLVESESSSWTPPVMPGLGEWTRAGDRAGTDRNDDPPRPPEPDGRWTFINP